MALEVSALLPAACLTVIVVAQASLHVDISSTYDWQPTFPTYVQVVCVAAVLAVCLGVACAQPFAPGQGFLPSGMLWITFTVS